MNKVYKLRFLPIFEKDLIDAANYITSNLQNPEAAYRLVDEIEHAIDKRLDNPLIVSPYKSNKFRKYPYYRINVRNFSIFYVVIGDIMEVRRLIYAKRDIDNLL